MGIATVQGGGYRFAKEKNMNSNTEMKRFVAGLIVKSERILVVQSNFEPYCGALGFASRNS